MLILTHVIIALTSLIVATVCLVDPTRTKLRINYALISATLISGTAMVLVTHASLLGACVSGLSYLAVAVVLSAVAEYRLAKPQM